MQGNIFSLLLHAKKIYQTSSLLRMTLLLPLLQLVKMETKFQNQFAQEAHPTSTTLIYFGWINQSSFYITFYAQRPSQYAIFSSQIVIFAQIILLYPVVGA